MMPLYTALPVINNALTVSAGTICIYTLHFWVGVSELFSASGILVIHIATLF
jgi:hypothetical protein